VPAGCVWRVWLRARHAIAEAYEEAMTRQELAADFYLFASLYSGKEIRVKFLTKREAKRFFKALKASAKRNAPA
jgi:hypothetical protein